MLTARRATSWLFNTRQLCTQVCSESTFQQLLDRARSCETSRRAAVARLEAWATDPTGPPAHGAADGTTGLQAGPVASAAPALTATAGGGDRANSGGVVGAAVAMEGVNELLRLCAQRGAVDDAIQVLAALERRGLQPDADTFAHLNDVFTYFPPPIV